MSDPLDLQIIAEIIDLLNEARPTGMAEATQRRFIPGEQRTDPRIAVFLGEEEPQLVGGRNSPLTQRNLVVAIQAIAAVEDPADADGTVAPMRAWVVSKLGKTNLGGLAHEVIEGKSAWFTHAADLLYVCVQTLWRVEYQTLRNDLTRAQ